ncbi:MAG TPA: hypothetical protein VMX35_16540 [Acidobacteriota bacterium]|nr:hypothetical protein [Acidobacteriota bacterium]
MIYLLLSLALLFPAQTGEESLDGLWDLFIERFEQAKVSALHRLTVESGLAFVAPALPDAGANSYRVFRRVRERDRLVYKPVARLAGGQLEQLIRGEAPGSVRSGDLLTPDGRPLRLAVRLFSLARIASALQGQLEKSVSSRLEATGLFRTGAVENAAYSDNPFLVEDIPRLRELLERQGFAAVLNIILRVSGNRVFLICQVISADEQSDEIFGISRSMTPELALLFTEESREPEMGGTRMLFSVPLPADVLDVAAFDYDGNEGDELAVLRHRELLIYSVGEGSTVLIKKIALTDLPRATYATRTPTGRVIPLDLNEDGHQELIIGSNLWSSGAVVWLDERNISFSFCDLQPLEAATLDGRPAFLAGRYRPGEDIFEDTLFIIDRNLTSRTTAEIGKTRALSSLDRNGELMLVVSVSGDLALWNRVSGNVDRESVKSGGAIRVGSALGGLKPGWIILAEAAPGGSAVTSMNIWSGVAAEHKISSRLDILAFTAYNPPGSRSIALAICGRDAFGGAQLVVYSWPWR